MAWRKVILANGCFDLLHYGHMRHLQAARQLGGRLIVAVTRDRSVNKGPGRPVFNELQRTEMLHALRFVSGTILVDDTIEALEKIRPDVLVKGQEYRKTIREDIRKYCDLRSIEIAFTNEVVYSSTKLLNFYDRPAEG